MQNAQEDPPLPLNKAYLECPWGETRCLCCQVMLPMQHCSVASTKWGIASLLRYDEVSLRTYNHPTSTLLPTLDTTHACAHCARWSWPRNSECSIYTFTLHCILRGRLHAITFASLIFPAPLTPTPIPAPVHVLAPRPAQCVLSSAAPAAAAAAEAVV